MSVVFRAGCLWSLGLKPSDLFGKESKTLPSLLTDPFGVAIMKDGPIPGIITEGHVEGRHKVLTAKRIQQTRN